MQPRCRLSLRRHSRHAWCTTLTASPHNYRPRLSPPVCPLRALSGHQTRRFTSHVVEHAEVLGLCFAGGVGKRANGRGEWWRWSVVRRTATSAACRQRSAREVVSRGGCAERDGYREVRKVTPFLSSSVIGVAAHLCCAHWSCWSRGPDGAGVRISCLGALRRAGLKLTKKKRMKIQLKKRKAGQDAGSISSFHGKRRKRKG